MQLPTYKISVWAWAQEVPTACVTQIWSRYFTNLPTLLRCWRGHWASLTLAVITKMRSSRLIFDLRTWHYLSYLQFLAVNLTLPKWMRATLHLLRKTNEVFASKPPFSLRVNNVGLHSLIAAVNSIKLLWTLPMLIWFGDIYIHLQVYISLVFQSHQQYSTSSIFTYSPIGQAFPFKGMMYTNQEHQQANDKSASLLR